MTIVDVTDSHGGFEVITSRIKATRISTLLKHHNQRLFFAGVIVIAANAGGAWSPIGDVTTTMLWIGGQITTANIMKTTLLASMVCMVVPLAMATFMPQGNVVALLWHPTGWSMEALARLGLRNQLCFLWGWGLCFFVPMHASDRINHPKQESPAGHSRGAFLFDEVFSILLPFKVIFEALARVKDKGYYSILHRHSGGWGHPVNQRRGAAGPVFAGFFLFFVDKFHDLGVTNIITAFKAGHGCHFFGQFSDIFQVPDNGPHVGDEFF